MNGLCAKLIVVDQLWLWVIRRTRQTNELDFNGNKEEPDLVITAFPERFNGRYDSANVYRCIIEHLERGLQPPLRRVEDLVALIVEHCTGVFFQRQLEHDKWFLEFFAVVIREVVCLPLPFYFIFLTSLTIIPILVRVPKGRLRCLLRGFPLSRILSAVAALSLLCPVRPILQHH